MADQSVADDLLRSGYERWARLEGEKQAISDDLKELFGELKAQGFDSKALRTAFRIAAKADDMTVQEHNAVVDLYVSSLLGPRGDVGTKPATRSRAAREAGDNRPSDRIRITKFDDGSTDYEEIDGKPGEVLTSKTFEPQSPQPAAQSHIQLRQQATPVPAESKGDEISAPIQEPQPSTAQTAPVDRCLTSATEPEAVESSEPIQPGTALKSTAARKDVRDNSTEGDPAPEALDPEAATTPPAGTNPPVDANSNSVGTESPSPLTEWEGIGSAPALPEVLPAMATSGEAQATAAATGASPVIRAAGDTGAQPAGGEDETAPESGAHGSTTGKPGPASAGPALAPGKVRHEKCPPAGMIRHDFQRCFPERWGPAVADLADDIRKNGIREPIVMLDGLLLDGWARYLVARDLGIEYPVTEYDGTDPLADVIRWNLESRNLSPEQRKSVASKMMKLPAAADRHDEIALLFGLETEGQAA